MIYAAPLTRSLLRTSLSMLIHYRMLLLFGATRNKIAACSCPSLYLSSYVFFHSGGA